MDLSIYAKDFTQHDLFGLFPGAAGGRALRDSYGRVYLVTIATKGGRTTLNAMERTTCASWLHAAAKPSATIKTPRRATSLIGTAHRSGSPLSPIPQPSAPAAHHPLPPE